MKASKIIAVTRAQKMVSAAKSAPIRRRSTIALDKPQKLILTHSEQNAAQALAFCALGMVAAASIKFSLDNTGVVLNSSDKHRADTVCSRLALQ